MTKFSAQHNSSDCWVQSPEHKSSQKPWKLHTLTRDRPLISSARYLLKIIPFKCEELQLYSCSCHPLLHKWNKGLALFKLSTKDSCKCLPFPVKASFTHAAPQQTHKNAICLAAPSGTQTPRTFLGASTNPVLTGETTGSDVS